MNERPIKFRAWDKTQKIFLAEDDFKWFAMRALWNDEKCCENIIWMQYTGLKDKNGKEIYEEDVVLVEGEKYKAFYNPDVLGFEFVSLPIEENDAFIETREITNNELELEVIGNAFENPDLVK